MSLWKNYHIATSIPEALQVLSAGRERARIIAGGSDLLLDLQQGRHPPVDILVDVCEIPELQRLEINPDQLYIGAAVTLNRIASSKLVLKHAQALVEACQLIGGPQVRNTATLGGNVAHALPAADGAIALLAMEARAEVARLDGRRMLPLEDLYIGPGKSSLHPQQHILVGFSIPVRENIPASCFQRIMRPQGVAIAILNMGVSLIRSGSRIEELRISVGPGGKIPFRARAVEKLLGGREFTPAWIGEGVEQLRREASFRTSRHRATQAYRLHMAGVLLESTLNTAWQRSFVHDQDY